MSVSLLSMPTPSVSPSFVQQCGLCHKPFLKESSYNRHILYCRRTRQRPKTRAKACRACSSAKVKCSLQPQCRRCISRGIECIYDVPESLFITAKASCSAATFENQTESRHLASEHLADGSGGQALNQLCEGADTDIHLDWDLFDFDASINVPGTSKSTLPGLLESSAQPVGVLTDDRHGTKVMDYTNGNLNTQDFSNTGPPWSGTGISQAEHSHALTRTTCLLEQVNGDHLLQIPKSDPVAVHTTKMVMEMLRAFPKMMLRRETLPPFIHGHWNLESSFKESALPEPLLNCMALAQVFASHSPETRTFLWRTVQSEQRDAIHKAEQGKLSKHMLLASIQAQLIYILMRMSDTSVLEPGFNFQLIVIFQRLCENFKRLCGQPFFQSERESPSINWEDWIFAESRRRIAVVWLLITQMVHIKIGVPCDSFEEFRDIPLPTPRSLWEARSLADWKSELYTYTVMPRIGMETVGDLINTCTQGDTITNSLRQDTWNAGTDILGVLLNLSVVTM